MPAVDTIGPPDQVAAKGATPLVVVAVKVVVPVDAQIVSVPLAPVANTPGAISTEVVLV